MSLMKEFKEFLNEYKVTGLAIAFIIGVAATALIKSLVDNIVMPTITPMIPGGMWKTYILTLGPFNWGIGAFIGEVINFIRFLIIKREDLSYVIDLSQLDIQEVKL